MPEPSRSRLRPIPMTRSLLVVLAALAVLAGCGSAEPGEQRNDSDTSSEPATSETSTPSAEADSTCAPSADAGRTATEIAVADLDGDGTPDPVGLTTAQDPCPGQLWAEVGDRDVTLALPTDEPRVTSAFAVAIPGRTSQVVVTRQDHPRGGFQSRVFALESDRLVELADDGDPLVPFVATDVREEAVSIDCTAGGFTVTRAVTHEPAGVAFAWDVQRTSYALDGVTVTAGSTEEIADNVLPGQLKQRYPELEKNAVFPSCRVP